jgi:hypothetical protein
MTEDCMQSQYSADFLFVKNTSRTYFIYITDNKDENLGQVFDKMDFCEKYGWLGHELGHIVQYKQKSKRQLLGFTFALKPKLDSFLSTKPLVKYLGTGYLRRIEQSVDDIAIEAGGGYELAMGSDYLLNLSNIPQSIKERYRKTYTPIQTIINKASKIVPKNSII